MKPILKIILSCFTSLIVLAIFAGISCAITPEGIKILSGDYTSPKLLSFDLISEKNLKLDFSREIFLEKITINEKNSSKSIILEKTNVGNGTWILDCEEELNCSKTYSCEGYVVDEKGNSLFFKNEFQGFNARIPEIVINEIRSEYTKPKTEFIEFFALSDGNLGGMQLITASDGLESSYIFPSVEVKKGEYIVLHCRSIEEGIIDETGNDTTISKGADSSTSRDLWVKNENARIGKNDVIILKERKNGKVLDAVLFCVSGYEEWKTEFLNECASLAVESGKWNGDKTPLDAACSDGLTVSRTLCRINYEANDKNSWIVVATGQSSPGKENIKEKYVPKTTN